MAHQYKRHYSLKNELKALCGAGNHPMLAEELHRVTCKNCQRSLVACLNVGKDKMVEYQGDRLVRINT